MRVRADVNRDKALVACKRCIEATFTESDWIELGYLTSSSTIVSNHPRLLRSLGFGDDDYGACVLDVLATIVGSDGEHLGTIEDFIRLEEWLSRNDAVLYVALYGGTLELPEEDLANLSDPAVIETHLHRIRRSILSDPEQAIGAAKELIESTAKIVLTTLGESFSATADMGELVKAVQTALALHPASVAADAKGADATKKVLGGLTSIAIGLAELRNLYGTGHGKATTAAGLRPRHAQLAVDAATTYCRILLATLRDPDAPWRTRVRPV
jgi:hypothetical protein